MRLFLIRHGETVDNITQVYAGSRDSELTNHGYQQATRLGRHLIATGLTFTHIFSSHLQRAFKTAEVIREAQISANSSLPSTTDFVPDVKQLPVLMEQDFGFYEGKPWYEKPPSKKSGEPDANRDTLGFVDVESKESMAARMDAFLEDHLIPLLKNPSNENAVVAIVSHGIILSVLWRRLLICLPPGSVSYTSDLLATRRNLRLEHLGSWSNTGYLELHMQRGMSSLLSQPALGPDVPAGCSIIQPASEAVPPAAAVAAEVAGPVQEGSGIQVGVQAEASAIAGENTRVENALPRTRNVPIVSAPPLLYGWTTIIKVVNGKDHLQGLKRTGGGVGSARHDAGQKSIETFFKRRKTS